MQPLHAYGELKQSHDSVYGACHYGLSGLRAAAAASPGLFIYM